MRPIRLRISGLNSFRESQEIDFSKLCETGVFGIFGPTGSGKSSVLDAITLALFGTVERASNNTQGILNHGEESLGAEFTFSLGTGVHRQTYRAERSYKRSGDKSVKASVCRLVELTNGEDVLASKADDMTAKIEQILGLSAQDFTRAVVLPQGKFAEFLTIKPKERRQMLERLFNLEVYGRRLSAKLSEKMVQTQLLLTGVVNRQQGLGDASAERIKLAQTELSEVDAQVTAHLEELKNLQARYEEVRTIWQLQDQLKKSQAALHDLSRRQDEVEGLKEKLIRAERAEQIRPRLKEVKKLEQSYQTASLTINELAQKLTTIQNKVESLNEEWNHAQAVRKEREPFLLRRLEQVEQGSILEKEKQAQEEQLKGLRQNYDDLAQQKKSLTAELMELEDKITALRRKEEGLNNRLQEIKIAPEDRERVAEALKILEALESITNTLRLQQEETGKVRAELNKARAETGAANLNVVRHEESLQTCYHKLLELENNKPALSEEALSKKGQELERLRSIVDASDKSLELWQQSRRKEDILSQKVDSVRAEITATEEAEQGFQLKLKSAKEKAQILIEKIKEFEEQNLASKLALSLKEDQPCPVCGSMDHPQLASPTELEEILKMKEKLNTVEKTVTSLEQQHIEIQTQLAVTRSNHQNLVRDLSNQQAEVELRKQEYVECSSRLPKVIQEITPDEQHRYISETETALQLEWNNLAQWKSENETLEEGKKAIQKQLKDDTEFLIKVQATLNNLSGQYEALARREQELVLEYEKVKIEFARIGQQGAEIRKQYQNHQAWDKESVSINQELKESILSLQEIDKIYNVRIKAKNTLDLALKEVEVEGKEVAQGVKDKQSKLQHLLDGKPAKTLLAELNNELEQVIERESNTQKRLGEANKGLIEISQHHAVLAREIQITSDNLKTAANHLQQELENAGFESTLVAAESLCSESERENLQKVIKDYEKSMAFLNGQVSTLTKDLNGQETTLEEWLAWPTWISVAEEAHEKALSSRGAAEKALIDVTARHQHWKELEAEKLKLEEQFNRLKTLQTLLRGNAFVEFIAEEQLVNVALDASERLGQLTSHRYALELDSDGGFIMRDNANGGYRRPVSTLSGGETFLTSLALALSLSSQIQLRGEVPLEFFFLDEGFGTLDPDLLEVVMQTLEKLHLQNLTIGIISHVPELQTRLARRLIVTPAQPGGAGSQVRLESG